MTDPHAHHPHHAMTAAEAEALVCALAPRHACAARDGRWSDPSTWSGGRVPRTGWSVTVPTRVLYDLPAADPLEAVIVRGLLSHATDADTALAADTLIVLPGGRYEAGTPAAPVPPHLTADVALGGSAWRPDADPSEMLGGLLAWGDVTACGAAKTPFVRLAEKALVGHDEVVLTRQPEGWREGDELALPPSGGDPAGMFYARRDAELRRLLALEDPGRVSLNWPLDDFHEGGYDAGGRLDFLPHLANLTRNVTFRGGVTGGRRAHCMFTGWCRPHLGSAAFVGLGRTTLAPGSRIGRYAVHFHQLLWNAGEPGPRFTLSNCVVRDSTKWAVAVHGSHLGAVKDNVVFGVEHAGFATEDGSEAHNTFAGNLVMGVTNGHGFWMNGVRNVWKENVVAGCWGDLSKPVINEFGHEVGGYGYWLVSNTGDPWRAWTVPTPDGATEEFVWCAGVRPGSFAGNECYSVRGGVYLDHRQGRHEVEALKVWSSYGNVYAGIAIAPYDTDGLTVKGLVSRGASVDVYSNVYTRLIGCDIQGCDVGVRDRAEAGVLLVEGCTLHNQVDVFVCLSLTSKAADPPPPGTPIKETLIDRSRLLGGVPLQLSATRDGESSRCPVADNWLNVEGWQGAEGDDFRVYWDEQLPPVIVPYEGDIQDVPGLKKKASPEPGLTNEVCWKKYGLAWAGAVAPATAAPREGVVGGIVDPVQGAES